MRQIMFVHDYDERILKLPRKHSIYDYLDLIYKETGSMEKVFDEYHQLEREKSIQQSKSAEMLSTALEMQAWYDMFLAEAVDYRIRKEMLTKVAPTKIDPEFPIEQKPMDNTDVNIADVRFQTFLNELKCGPKMISYDFLDMGIGLDEPLSKFIMRIVRIGEYKAYANLPHMFKIDDEMLEFINSHDGDGRIPLLYLAGVLSGVLEYFTEYHTTLLCHIAKRMLYVEHMPVHYEQQPAIELKPEVLHNWQEMILRGRKMFAHIREDIPAWRMKHVLGDWNKEPTQTQKKN